MTSVFTLIVTVCALTGECSDIMLGVYQNEAVCEAAAAEQQVKGDCLPYKAADDQQPAFQF
ncbi:YebW family protein [Enterobacter sp. MW07]|nr:YebW family protein [Enterobacter sp. MW07]